MRAHGDQGKRSGQAAGISRPKLWGLGRTGRLAPCRYRLRSARVSRCHGWKFRDTGDGRSGKRRGRETTEPVGDPAEPVGRPVPSPVGRPRWRSPAARASLRTACSRSAALAFHQLPQDQGQDTAVTVVFHFDGAVDANDGREGDRGTVFATSDDRDGGARLQVTTQRNVKLLATGQSQGLPRLPLGKFQGSTPMPTRLLRCIRS